MNDKHKPKKKLKNEKYAKNYILIAKCKTEVRASELEELLNGPAYVIGVTAEDEKLYLHQLEAEKPYGKREIEWLRNFAKAWNKLVNGMSV